MASLPLPLLPAPLRWTGVAVVAVAIFGFSVLAVPPADPGPAPPLLPLDKWLHVLGYAGLGGALAYATIDWDWPTPWLVVGVVCVVTVYGAGIEVWQATVPERYFSVADAIANAVGGLLAAPLLALRHRLTLVSLRDLLGNRSS